MPSANKLTMYFRMTFSPVRTFAELSEQPPEPWLALGWMLLFRVPLSWAANAIGYAWIAQAQRIINNPNPELLDFIGRFTDQADSALYELQRLPSLPPLGVAWLWLGLLALLGVIGLWMHNVAWDHTALWMLQGTKPKPSLRFSCAAIAEAMGAASLGSLLGLLATIPVAGLLLLPVISFANIFYWGLRGVSLAAYHNCPIWKGVAATALHLLLAVVFYGLAFLLSGLLIVTIMLILFPNQNC